MFKTYCSKSQLYSDLEMFCLNYVKYAEFTKSYIEMKQFFFRLYFDIWEFSGGVHLTHWDKIAAILLTAYQNAFSRM